MKAESISQLGLGQAEGLTNTSKFFHSRGIYEHTHKSVKPDMRRRLRKFDPSTVNWGMTSDIAGKIVAFRRAKGMNQTEFSELVNVTQGTVSRWEKGANPDPDALVSIARALGITTDALISSDDLRVSVQPLGPMLFVKGAVAAGQWIEALEWPDEEWRSFTGRPDVTADLSHRFGLLIQGDSMNEIYPEGTVVECVSLFGQAEALPGKRVVILRRRSSDNCLEATVKELVEIDGALWAKPRSYNPAHQAFRLDQPEVGISEVKIAAVVVAATRLE